MARFDYGPWDEFGYGGGYGYGGHGGGPGHGNFGFFDVDLGGGPLIGFLYRPFKPWFD